ncbi:hypothetical protein DFH06DRAFT_1144900 [Mycena polygramma]|nr:hypothetical protein DFH06DRAFT_1144900 [Mycena polygramma]
MSPSRTGALLSWVYVCARREPSWLARSTCEGHKWMARRRGKHIVTALRRMARPRVERNGAGSNTIDSSTKAGASHINTLHPRLTTSQPHGEKEGLSRTEPDPELNGMSADHVERHKSRADARPAPSGRPGRTGKDAEEGRTSRENGPGERDNGVNVSGRKIG